MPTYNPDGTPYNPYPHLAELATRHSTQPSDSTKRAWLLLTLQAQVSNGSFRQWHVNGYSTEITEVRQAVQRFDNPYALQVSTILEEVETILNRHQHGDSLMTDQERQRLDTLSHAYLNLSDDFLAETENEIWRL